MRIKGIGILFLATSLFLIVAAIAVTAFISRNQKSADNADIRARANVTTGLKLTGTLVSTDQAAATATVDNVRFAEASDQTKNLGTWTVKLPTTVDYATLALGKKIVIVVDAKTFLIDQHSVTAVEIRSY